MDAKDKALIAANARIMQLERALFAMLDAYEGVYDTTGPPDHRGVQSASAKHAEGLAKDALADILRGRPEKARFAKFNPAD